MDTPREPLQREFSTTPERSKTMSAIRAKDTKPEISLRKALWSMGVRNYRKYPKLPGKPDLIFPKHKIVVFVDGCFWHGCPKHFRTPKSNKNYWDQKIVRNTERDREVSAKLKEMGYKVIRVWEHDVCPDPDAAVKIITRSLQRRAKTSKINSEETRPRKK
jgi:DNA mismatch endonuclease (patch repair protein)